MGTYSAVLAVEMVCCLFFGDSVSFSGFVPVFRVLVHALNWYFLCYAGV